MHLTIHTLPIIRNEIRTYKSLIKERDKLIEEYETPLKSLKNELLEVEGKLSQIKSPGKSDGLGGFVQDSVDKSIESMEFQEYKKFNTFRGYK